MNISSFSYQCMSEELQKTFFYIYTRQQYGLRKNTKEGKGEGNKVRGSDENEETHKTTGY